MHIRVILGLVLVALAQAAVAQDAVTASTAVGSPSAAPAGWEWGVGVRDSAR